MLQNRKTVFAIRQATRHWVQAASQALAPRETSPAPGLAGHGAEGGAEDGAAEGGAKDGGAQGRADPRTPVHCVFTVSVRQRREKRSYGQRCLVETLAPPSIVRGQAEAPKFAPASRPAAKAGAVVVASKSPAKVRRARRPWMHIAL